MDLLQEFQDFTSSQKICLVVTFVACLGSVIHNKLPINYGKHAKSILQISLPAQIAWVIFESPNLIWYVYFYYNGEFSHIHDNFVAILPFLIHYINRTIIYPLRNPTNKKVPIEIVVTALLFTSFNGYLQCSYLMDTKVYERCIFSYKSLWIGYLIFFIGLVINIRSDNHLADLKRQCIEMQKKGDKKEYLIPSKGLFKYVTQANYFGEVIEYLGYGILTQSFVGFWFCFTTLIVLGLRARDNHNWYLSKFPSYPKDRKRIIPYIY